LNVRLTLEERVATFRCSSELELRLNQLADATGYSRSKVIRKLVEGGMRMLEEQQSVHDMVIALNRLSKVR
jgi:predicted DNA-binding protein